MSRNLHACIAVLRSVERRTLGRAVLVAAPAALFLALAAWQTCGFRRCPDVAGLASFQPGGAPPLLDRDGKPFADHAPPERTIIALPALPSHVADAFLAVEDQRFYEHDAVDWRRVIGAALVDLRSGRFAQGFSTITMQLARSVFPEWLPAEKTLRRKLLEIRVAREIEQKFSKQEILELYLNHIYMGEGTYGVENAARRYFGIPARNLSLSQSAMLAAMVRAPGIYDPRRHPDAARKRRNLVLTLMEEQGRAPRADVDAARNAPLLVTARPRRPATEEEKLRAQSAQSGNIENGTAERPRSAFVTGPQPPRNVEAGVVGSGAANTSGSAVSNRMR